MPEPENVRIGCSGWSYKDWVGPFYPSNTEAKDYLKLYSRTFDCVEIDSSFYRIPSPGMVSQWKSSTPEGFTFCPKLSKKITHENKLENFESTLLYFYSVVSKLGDKLGPIVVQLPPSVKVEKHHAAMERFVSSLEPKFKHAIEFRHKSWFTPETYKLLEKNNVAMAWSINQYLETPPEVTADFVYLRMVGTREITQFTGIQKEMREEMEHWAKELREKRASIKDSFVFFNNHFAGFGPESVNEFRRLLGMIEVDWTKSQESTQATLQ
ncbi:MAG: DUF72 domain-containing protein [Nitrososphaerales archaeon]